MILSSVKPDAPLVAISLPKVEDAIAKASKQLTLQESFKLQGMNRVVSRLFIVFRSSLMNVISDTT